MKNIDTRVTFTLHGTTYRVQPENEAKWRAEAEKAAKPYRKRRITAGSRQFPAFVPGMTTGAYIEAYRARNTVKADGWRRQNVVCVAAPLVDDTWPGWHHVAPVLDPSIPECFEWEAEE